LVTIILHSRATTPVLAGFGLLFALGLIYFIRFANRHPRLAVRLILYGYVLYLLSVVVVVKWPQVGVALVVTASLALGLGALAGYLAGGLAASLFLLADVVRAVLDRNRPTHVEE